MAAIKFIIKIVEGLVGGLIETLFDLIKSFMSTERKTMYDADFMSKAEQANLLSTSNPAFVLDGVHSLSFENSFKHVIVSGKTGNFKTSGILLPNIYKLRHVSSMVILDPSSECLFKSSGAIIQAKGNVAVLNYTKPHASQGFNPIKRYRTRSELRKLSKMLTNATLGKNARDPFWNLSCENLISFFLIYVVFYQEEKYHTLYQIYWLLNRFTYDPQAIDRLLVGTKDEQLLNEYKGILTFGDKMLSGIVASALSVLSMFGQDPELALVTSHDTLDFSLFRREKGTSLFINTSTKDIQYYSVINSILLDQLFAEIMSELPQKETVPVFFLLEEASSLTFDNFQIIISNIRKFDAGILHIYQSAQAQLTELYGAAAAKSILENNFARIFMPGQTHSVAAEMEQSFGTFEYRDEETGARVVRPLMTASEIQQCKQCLIQTSNNPPIKKDITPYFKQNRLLKLSNLPPYEQPDLLPFQTPPILNF
jgi:type IV secretory pathway TraG/TraD family ATPase VirD4